MSIKIKFRDFLAAALFVAGVVIALLAVDQMHVSGNTEKAARRLTRILERQTDKLDAFAEEALAQDPSAWLQLKGLPEDMVIYRYTSDTLQSWVNEFPIINDDIRVRVYVPFISNPQFRGVSPLSYLTEEYSFVEMGHKWYVAKAVSNEHSKVIAAFELSDRQMYGTGKGTNPRFRLEEEFSIRPLSSDGGSAVYVNGIPQFQVLCDNINTTRTMSYHMPWLAMLFMVASAMFFLLNKRSIRRLVYVIVVLTVSLGVFYFWGRDIKAQVSLFSPMLYAGSEILYSLGSVIIINMFIFLLAASLCLAKLPIAEGIRSRKALNLLTLGVLAAIALICVYTQVSLRSIILNSTISLELYKLSELTPVTFVIYASYISMLLSIPMLLQVLQKPFEEHRGLRFNSFSLTARVTFAVLVAVYLVVNSAVLGFDKEKNRLEVLSNRLSFDRDISLEYHLRRMETQIAEDMIISALSVFHNTETSIATRIRDNYMLRNNQDYTVSAYVFNSSNNTRAAANLYHSLIEDGVPVSDNSRFLFVKRDSGNPYYLGIFFYLIEGSGVSRVLVKIESDEVRTSKGYASIFGISSPGKATIPAGYSYARYEGKDLKSYKGNYAYPLELDLRTRERIYDEGLSHLTNEGKTHFCTIVGDREVVMLSRDTIGVLTYVVSSIFVALVAFLVVTLLQVGKKKERIFDQSYYRNRISFVLLASLLSTLLVMAVVSVLFVNSRNESNMRNVMYDKIVSVTSMIEDEVAASQARNLDMSAMRQLIEQVGADTNSDINLYSRQGRLLLSTAPMVFNRQLLDERIDGVAYGKIVRSRNSYYIQKETMGMVSFYSMYSPIVNEAGDIIAIISSPYSEGVYDFEEDAVMHSITIISLFLVFLLIALFVVSRVVDKMFRPLSEMSHRMNAAGLDNLEQIDYDRNDEISSIVKAYNRMVTQLSESTRRLAQAERDKAWSEMARQVAHEIKNPLTPMKLQLQRVIRLKEKGNPAWQERFDEASRILLDHIDVLTETANEFSTFAKLYSEEHTEIDLDKLLMEEISLFDNKDNIKIEFLGLEDVRVCGPKPQLTRVFVNLLNNSVQAIGEDVEGQILVSLRHSVKEGFYDIVFEDSGPGVSEENAVKLFTPNFTTKNSGSGLGLAISRSILERCGASISYSKSFSLGGACFTITYPKSS